MLVWIYKMYVKSYKIRLNINLCYANLVPLQTPPVLGSVPMMQFGMSDSNDPMQFKPGIFFYSFIFLHSLRYWDIYRNIFQSWSVTDKGLVSFILQPRHNLVSLKMIKFICCFFNERDKHNQNIILHNFFFNVPTPSDLYVSVFFELQINYFIISGDK